MRSVAIQAEAEFRSTAAGHTFTGYAAVFDTPSEPLGTRGVIETVRPGAFTRTLASPHRKTFVVDHSDMRLLASTASGHLQLSSDSRGLVTEANLPDTPTAREVRELHERGETSGMSFEFSPTKDGAPYLDNGKARELRDVRLYHVSILQGLNPAYSATTAEMRALADAISADPEDVSAVVDAITEQRRLTPGEWSLVERLLAAVKPDEPEPRAIPANTPNLAAARELLGVR